jgi:hypothetical protein
LWDGFTYYLWGGGFAETLPDNREVKPSEYKTSRHRIAEILTTPELLMRAVISFVEEREG